MKEKKLEVTFQRAMLQKIYNNKRGMGNQLNRNRCFVVNYHKQSLISDAILAFDMSSYFCEGLAWVVSNLVQV